MRPEFIEVRDDEPRQKEHEKQACDARLQGGYSGRIPFARALPVQTNDERGDRQQEGNARVVKHNGARGDCGDKSPQHQKNRCRVSG